MSNEPRRERRSAGGGFGLASRFFIPSFPLPPPLCLPGSKRRALPDAIPPGPLVALFIPERRLAVPPQPPLPHLPAYPLGPRKAGRREGRQRRRGGGLSPSGREGRGERPGRRDWREAEKRRPSDERRRNVAVFWRGVGRGQMSKRLSGDQPEWGVEICLTHPWSEGRRSCFGFRSFSTWCFLSLCPALERLGKKGINGAM